MRKEFISKTVEVKQNDCFEMYIIIFEYHRSVSIVFFFFFKDSVPQFAGGKFVSSCTMIRMILLNKLIVREVEVNNWMR